MVALRRAPNGGWHARKRLPNDVREEYGRLYGRTHEELFHRPALTSPGEAKRDFSEWLADAEARIAAIRAQRSGQGLSLSQRQASALAGEWYRWFTSRHPLNKADFWEAIRDNVAEALEEAAGEEWRRDPSRRDELWNEDEELREAVRPMLADIGQTTQFLHFKKMTLTSEARKSFLDNLYHDLAAALRLLTRQANGDFRPDKYAERFPKFEAADAGETPMQLFEAWVRERQPAHSTVESWSSVFNAMAAHFDGRSGGSITVDEAQQWIKGLVTKQRTASTVRNTWMAASKTVFGWAAEHKRIQSSPFGNVKLTVPRQVKRRETQAFRPEEWRRILKAALQVTDTRKPFCAAQRWVPWLCAYTGARPGEITQLRKRDVIEQDSIFGLLLTPDAGNIKTGQARTVPLHEHLVAQEFLEFVKNHKDGPLFYKPGPKAPDVDPLKAKKPRSAQVRQRLAAWVRELGVNDPELQPNHAWRHTFKQIADEVGISERMSDSITGHAHKSVGAGYGKPTMKGMAEALKKFPRYEWGDKCHRQEQTDT